MIWDFQKSTSILTIKKPITTFLQNIYFEGLQFLNFHDLAQDMLNPL
jgi:hypothetical protein